MFLLVLLLKVKSSRILDVLSLYNGEYHIYKYDFKGIEESESSISNSEKIRFFKYSMNNTFRVEYRSGLNKSYLTYHFDFDDDEGFVVSDSNHEPVIEGSVLLLLNGTLYFSGKFNNNLSITGLFDIQMPSEAIIRDTTNGKSSIIRVIPAKRITYTELVHRLTPAFAILFFYGFGRNFRKRFWRQFNQMNTLTLQNRMNEAKKNM